MWYSYTSTGLRTYLRIVASRSAGTTIVLWIQRLMLATMQAELVSWRNVPGRKDLRQRPDSAGAASTVVSSSRPVMVKMRTKKG